MIAFLALLFAVAGTLPCAARSFPRLEPANTEIVLLDDARVDLALRIERFQRARTVDILTYVLKSDPEAGLGTIKALRQVLGTPQSRVRLVYESFASLMDPLASWTERLNQWANVPAALLSDDSLPGRAEIYPLFPSEKKAVGLERDDYFHEKMAIVDAGTKDEVIFLGGRNYGKQAFEFGDSAVLIRPIDPAKPYLGTQLKEYFEETISLVSRHFAPYPRSRLSSRARAALEVPEIPLLRPGLERAGYGKLGMALAAPYRPGGFVYRPRAVQLLANDMISQALAFRDGGSSAARVSFRSHIDDFLADAAAHAKDIELVAYLFNPPAELEQAMAKSLDAGGTLHLVTNGKASHANVLPFSSAPYYVSVANTRRLMEHARTPANFPAYFLEDPARAGYAYLHRKIFLADDELAVTGCDNFTLSSKTKNNEVSIAVWDRDFAHRLRKLTQSELPAYRREDAAYLKDQITGFFPALSVWLLGGLVRDTY